MPNLEDLNKNGFIDTTQGKITEPAKGTANSKPTLEETDPAFMPSSKTPPATGKVKRTPVIADRPQPSIKVVNAKFDASQATEFDINTLEKRHTEPTEADMELMGQLDAAVEREKKSITERVHALTEKQREEFEMMKQAKMDQSMDDAVDPAASSIENGFFDEDDDFDEDNYAANGVDEPKAVEEVQPRRIIVPKKPVEVDMNDEVNASIGMNDTELPADIAALEAEEAISEETSEPDSKEDQTTEVDIDDEIGDDFAVDTNEDESEDERILNSIADTDDLDKDLAEEIGESPEPDTDAIMNEFTQVVKSRINPVKNVIDLNKFKIGSKPVEAIEDHLSFSKISVADHFLPNAGKVISCSALSGTELMALNPENSNRNRLNTMRDIFKIIYKHIVSPKPKTFEEWMKTTRFTDLDHIYFCLYKATFSGSHFLHYECPNAKCKHVFIKDVDFDDMIVYPSDEVKEKMQNILNSGDYSPAEYEVTLHQISDEYVVGLRNPSIYNVSIEVATLSNDFLQKYSDLMDFIVYIDSIYRINYETQTLEPIDMKPDKDSVAKTTARRIHTIAKVLRNLPSDNYYELRKRIAEVYPNLTSVTYRIPEAKCEKCGTTIPAVDVEAQTLLFMRHQLGAFVVL